MDIRSVFCHLNEEWKVEPRSNSEACIYNLGIRLKATVYAQSSSIPIDSRIKVAHSLITKGSFTYNNVKWMLNLYGSSNIYFSYFYTVFDNKSIVVEFVSKIGEEFEIVLHNAKDTVKKLDPLKYFVNSLRVADKYIEFIGWKEKKNDEVVKLQNKDVFCNITKGDDFNSVLTASLEDSCKGDILAELNERIDCDEYNYASYTICDKKPQYLQLLQKWGLLFLSYGSEFLDLRQVFVEEAN